MQQTEQQASLHGGDDIMSSAIRSACVAPERISGDDGRDEYYYGYRTIIGQGEDGETTVTYRPLTLEDFLEPEEGDVYIQGNLHENDVDMQKSIFRSHLRDRKGISVYSDLKMEWGIKGLQNPAPDISVVRGEGSRKAERQLLCG